MSEVEKKFLHKINSVLEKPEKPEKVLKSFSVLLAVFYKSS